MSEQAQEKRPKEIVIPGQYIEDLKGRKLGEGVYAEGEKVYSQVVGLPRSGMYDVSVLSLSGKYVPIVGDKVVAIVDEVESSGWLVDINSPYEAFLHMSEAVEDFIDTNRTDLSSYFMRGDIIFCRVSRVTSTKSIQVSMRDAMARKLQGGVIIKVTPTKIPRIIGKAGSMITMIKQKTKCDIYTGQNGLVWVRGENKDAAIEAILTIDRESHLPGLTEKIEKMLGG